MACAIFDTYVIDRVVNRAYNRNMSYIGYEYQIRIGTNIRRYRLESGISQREMERRYGISRTYLCKLESGKHCPTIETLRLLAKAYGITPSMFFLDNEGNELPYL